MQEKQRKKEMTTLRMVVCGILSVVEECLPVY